MYKLEGFDKDWIDLGNRRRATYTDLNDGSYLLRVRAANSEGVWNEAGFAVQIALTTLVVHEQAVKMRLAWEEWHSLMLS